jgi:hypothetical protein
MVLLHILTGLSLITFSTGLEIQQEHGTPPAVLDV